MTRGADQSCGVRVSTSDGFIEAIDRYGLFAIWNANAANRKQRIEVGDYVIDVNGSKDFNAIVRWAQKKYKYR